jgi:hypothetical protein
VPADFGGTQAMRFLTWNISHGGSSRIAAICKQIAEHRPGILVLTEFQT